jgi:hypothetical protein
VAFSCFRLVHVFLIYPILATCPTHGVLVELITLELRGQAYSLIDVSRLETCKHSLTLYLVQGSQEKK